MRKCIRRSWEFYDVETRLVYSMSRQSIPQAVSQHYMIVNVLPTMRQLVRTWFLPRGNSWPLGGTSWGNPVLICSWFLEYTDWNFYIVCGTLHLVYLFIDLIIPVWFGTDTCRYRALLTEAAKSHSSWHKKADKSMPVLSSGGNVHQCPLEELPQHNRDCDLEQAPKGAAALRGRGCIPIHGPLAKIGTGKGGLLACLLLSWMFVEDLCVRVKEVQEDVTRLCSNRVDEKDWCNGMWKGKVPASFWSSDQGLFQCKKW